MSDTTTTVLVVVLLFTIVMMGILLSLQSEKLRVQRFYILKIEATLVNAHRGNTEGLYLMQREVINRQSGPRWLLRILRYYGGK